MYREITSPEDSHQLQRDLDTLNACQNWQMAFNTDKCFIMRTTLAKKRIFHHQYNMGGTPLQITPDITYLRVILNNKLQWDTQVNKACAKSMRLLGFLRRNMYNCPAAIKERAYTTLVRPLVEYSSPVWSPHTQRDIKKVEKIQRVAARFVTRCPTRRSAPDSVSELISSLGWVSLVEARREKASIPRRPLQNGRKTSCDPHSLPPGSKTPQPHQIGKLQAVLSKTVQRTGLPVRAHPADHSSL